MSKATKTDSILQRSKVEPGGISTLCTHCSKIRLPQRNCGTWIDETVLIPTPAEGRIQPQSCRICAIVSERHRMYLKTSQKTGNHANLDIVKYSLHPIPDQPALEVNLRLSYPDNDSFDVCLAMVPPECKSACSTVASGADKIPDVAAKYLGYVARSLPPKTRSPESIEFLKSKLEYCQNNHQICRQRWEDTRNWLPSRLLEIAAPNAEMVYLRDRQELEVEPYFTLSHCWGKSKPIQLTADSEATLRGGFSVSDLPKTFQDAVAVSNEFSVRYLWVDSLCIAQDNLSDWHSEAAVMNQVYSCALCNIAAAGASDSSIGLFFERNPTAECAFRLQTNFDFDPNDYWGGNKTIKMDLYPDGTYEVFPRTHWTELVEKSILNRRAWVVQERFLSTRVLHFTASLLFWECLENSSSEVFPEVVPPFARPFWTDDTQDLKRTLFTAPKDDRWHNSLYRGWQVLARNYTRCGMTRESDILAAINGIRQQLFNCTGDIFVAGLWRSRLVQELCWQRSPDPREVLDPFHTREWRAPTWSWAGAHLEMHPGHRRHHHRHDNLRDMVTIKAIDYEEFKSGQLKHASLTLRGKLVFSTIVLHGPSDVPSTVEFICGEASIKGQQYGDDSLKFILDNRDAGIPYREELVCLAMWECYCKRDSNLDPLDLDKKPTRYLEALALKPQKAEGGVYERVGILLVPEHAYNFYISKETKDEHSLVLV